MARIRTIKPSFFTSLTVADLTAEQRLTFIGLWTYVDDWGAGVDDARLVKAAVWPLDDRTSAGVEEDLAVMATLGLVCRYQVDGKPYLHVTHFDEHQAISHRGKPLFARCPHHFGRPPELSGSAPEVSGDPPELSGDLPELSGSVPENLRLEEGRGKREEGRGSREEGVGKSSSSTAVTHEGPGAPTDDDDRPPARTKPPQADQPPEVPEVPYPPGGDRSAPVVALAAAAIDVLAERHLAARETEKGQVSDPEAWMAADRRRTRRRHAAALAAALAALGPAAAIADPATLADRLEPPHRPPPGPLDATAAAARRLAERNAGAPCPTCDTRGGSGWVTTPDGAAARCPACWPARGPVALAVVG